jgi:hypothetical protein
VQIAEVQRAAAELDARIASLQARVNQGRNKVMLFVRSTVDTPMVPPAGGGICTGMHTYPGPYHTEPMIIDANGRHLGPAVKRGDFKTAQEKEKAIRAAKEELIPLEQELRTLRDESAKAKDKLTKLRAAPAPN